MGGSITDPLQIASMSSSQLCRAEACLALSRVWATLGKCYEHCLGLGVVTFGEGTGNSFSRRPSAFGRWEWGCCLSLKVSSMILLVVPRYGH